MHKTTCTQFNMYSEPRQSMNLKPGAGVHHTSCELWKPQFICIWLTETNKNFLYN